MYQSDLHGEKENKLKDVVKNCYSIFSTQIKSPAKREKLL